MEIEVRPRDALLTLAYLAGIYSLSFSSKPSAR